VALLWKREGGVLFPADTCVHRRGIKLPFSAEDLGEARENLATLAARDFETICFMHGAPILARADQIFRQTWPPHHHREGT
jgi:glyoxylase-like metal-dependent hydrolase (beta-lactamase superfamily II)